MSLAPWALRYPVAQHEITPEGLPPRLEHLTRINELFLRTHLLFPPLYWSGVRYRGAPLGEECWLPAPWARYSYFAGETCDCKSLATWRAAELRLGGERASCFVTRTRSVSAELDLVLYHVLVRRGDGSVEDPSTLLGMGREAS